MSARPDFATLLAATPRDAGAIDWPARVALLPELAPLATCPQDAAHHGEGDVATHTRMVLAELLAATEDAPAEIRDLLIWTAILHDVGKPATTRREPDGRVSARGHSRVGAAIARGALYEIGAPILWREALCRLIARHQTPFWLIERPEPRRAAIEIAQSFVGAATARLLLAHAEADARGRIAADQDRLLDQIALAGAVFEESGLLDAPWPFANAESRVTYFERDGRDPTYAAHEAFASEMTMLVGLPGAGKDSWIARAGGDRPMVSLDAIRARLGVGPTEDQGAVAQAATAAARDHLRAGRDFIWNATNISRQVRAPRLQLARDYGARLRIVYLEPPFAEQRRRNRARDAAVPEAVIDRFLRRLEPPDPREAHEVVWLADAAETVL